MTAQLLGAGPVPTGRGRTRQKRKLGPERNARDPVFFMYLPTNSYGRTSIHAGTCIQIYWKTGAWAAAQPVPRSASDKFGLIWYSSLCMVSRTPPPRT